MERTVVEFQHFSENLARDPDYLDRFLTEDEAARFMGYTSRCLQNWRVRGEGPFYIHISNKAVRYRKRDIILWAENRLVNSTSEFKARETG
jgi:predicted DNA-binding transcriptional regulator AlpA